MAVVFPCNMCGNNNCSTESKMNQEKDLQSWKNNTVPNSLDIVTPNESEKGGSPPSEADSSSLSREQLIHDQEMDVEIRCLAENVITKEKVVVNSTCYCKKCGTLMEKWRPRAMFQQIKNDLLHNVCHKV